LQGGWSGIDVVRYVWRPWGIHIDIVRDRGSKGMDRCPLTGVRSWRDVPLQIGYKDTF
jgi:hypothetical protein